MTKFFTNVMRRTESDPSKHEVVDSNACWANFLYGLQNLSSKLISYISATPAIYLWLT